MGHYNLQHQHQEQHQNLPMPAVEKCSSMKTMRCDPATTVPPKQAKTDGDEPVPVPDLPLVPAVPAVEIRNNQPTSLSANVLEFTDRALIGVLLENKLFVFKALAGTTVSAFFRPDSRSKLPIMDAEWRYKDCCQLWYKLALDASELSPEDVAGGWSNSGFRLETVVRTGDEFDFHDDIGSVGGFLAGLVLLKDSPSTAVMDSLQSADYMMRMSEWWDSTDIIFPEGYSFGDESVVDHDDDHDDNNGDDNDGDDNDGDDDEDGDDAAVCDANQ